MALVEAVVDALPAKRLKLEDVGERPRPDLTAEQKVIVERNRQLALARRSERQKAPETSAAEEQQERIRRNREAALLRKRQREAAADGRADDQDVLQSSQGLERTDQELAPAVAMVDSREQLPMDVCKDESETSKEAPAKQSAEKEQQEPAALSRDEPEEPQEILPKSIEDPSDKAQEDVSDQTTEEGQAKSEGEDEEDGDEEESSGCEYELSSGSCSSSEDGESSSSSDSSESMGEGEEEEDIVEDAEHEDENEERQDEDREREDEDQEEKEEEDEEEAPVNWDLRRSARPQNEPPCCTQRWEPVALKALAAGEAIPPKSRELRSAKQSLVAKLLCRWWYVLPDWPPSDFDYTGALAERGYRCVAVSDFEIVDETEGNLRRVFALPNGYKGLYRDESGAVIDVRPVEGRPSYDQLMCRSHAELHDLLLLAYTRQLEVLESKTNSGQAEEALKQQLRLELKKAKNSLFKFGSIGAKP